MSKYKISIILAVILSLIALFLKIYNCQAEIRHDELKLAQGDYQRVSPTDPYSISPQPDIIDDKEWREDRQEALKKEQPKAEEEKVSAEEKPVIVGSEPTKIYYKISVNDKLYISVWRVPDLSLEFIVGPDGKISFPLIGDVDAAGKTLSELDAELTEKLKEYVENPQVSVMVREFAGDKVIVLGEVVAPGIYKFVGKTKIIQIIALAGGFTDRARSASVIIVREPDDPKKERNFIVADIKNILKGRLSKNIEVRPDDIIYVSRTVVANVKEFYNNWIIPLMSSATDVETWRSIKESRIRAHK